MNENKVLDAAVQLEETLAFFKLAFCIDGEAELDMSVGDYRIGGVIKMTDSKRGTFYIAMVHPKD